MMEKDKVEVVKNLTIWELARGLERYRFNEAFVGELLKKHGELLSLAYAFNVSPGVVFKALVGLDDLLRKD